MRTYTTEVIDWPNKPCIAIIAWSCLGRDDMSSIVGPNVLRSNRYLCDKRHPFLVRSRLLNLLQLVLRSEFWWSVHVGGAWLLLEWMAMIQPPLTHIQRSYVASYSTENESL